MGNYKVVEKFISINGEGQCAGELAYFIRFAGCNLRCSYCDTRWANEESAPYELLSEEELYGAVKESGVKNVTLTGGEPLIQKNIARLITLLSKDKELRIEIETNGAVSLKPFAGIGENVVFTMDYKLPDSGMEGKMLTENFSFLGKNDTIKFVAGSRKDLDTARKVISRYKLTEKGKLYISSSFGKITPKEIVEYMIENKMTQCRLQLQMHKYIWEPDRKGV